MPPLNLQVIIKMSYCFGYWISLIHDYISTTFVSYFVEANKPKLMILRF